MKKKGKREGGEKGDCGMMGWGKAKEKSGGCVCVCTHVPFGSTRERGRQRRSAVTAGVSNRSQEPQWNLAASLVNQWASVSDLIGPGSETDGLFSERIGSCTGRMEGGQRWTMASSPSLSDCAWCLCVCTSVLEAAVFADAFPLPPPREAVCVCVTEKEKCMLWFEQC